MDQPLLDPFRPSDPAASAAACMRRAKDRADELSLTDVADCPDKTELFGPAMERLFGRPKTTWGSKPKQMWEIR
jgi:hypothetical protein